MIYYLQFCLQEEHLHADINPYMTIKNSEGDSGTVIHTDSSPSWLFSKIIHILLHFSSTSYWMKFVICKKKFFLFFVIFHSKESLKVIEASSYLLKRTSAIAQYWFMRMSRKRESGQVYSTGPSFLCNVEPITLDIYLALIYWF